MRLTLGTRCVDLTTRALVVAPPGPGDRPDIAEIRAAAQEASPPAGTLLASWLEAATSMAAKTALDAGAVLVGAVDPGSPLDGLLAACARSGATVVVAAPGDRFERVRARLVERARQAENAGLSPDRVVVEAPLTSALLPHLRRFAELGYPMLVTVTAPVAAALETDQAALTALALIDGARLIRTDAVRPTSRVCRVVSAILEAR